jgi:hypothetical protein
MFLNQFFFMIFNFPNGMDVRAIQKMMHRFIMGKIDLNN